MTNKQLVNSQRITSLEAFEGLEKALLSFLKTVPPSVLPYTGHLAQALGKNLRGKALLIAALGDDDLLDPGAIDLAVAIEMFHLATLVHDDIIDNAKTRRGQKSLQAQFDKKTAVLCGDYLLARSLELSMKAMSSQAAGQKNRDANDFSLATYASLVCLGEIRQNANNFNLDLTVMRYLSIIRGKTAVLFEAALAGGEFFVQEEDRINPAAKEAYKKLGRYMGMIFQMMDDLIDIEKTEAEAKKPILSDLKAGVITLPLILAMEEKPAIRGEIEEQMRTQSLNPEKIQALVLDAGGDVKTRALAKNYYILAKEELDKLNLKDHKHNLMLKLLDKAAGNE